MREETYVAHLGEQRKSERTKRRSEILYYLLISSLKLMNLLASRRLVCYMNVVLVGEKQMKGGGREMGMS